MNTQLLANSGLARKFAALFEILGVLVAGNLAALYLIPGLGIKPLGPILQSALQVPAPDFISLSIVFFQTKSVQYGCLLLLAFTVGWWRRRLPPRSYGVTTAGQSIWNLVALGMLAFALVALPIKLLWVAKQLVALGQGSPFWVLLDKEWTASFWLFMAVASFAFQPVIEELFFRGYCQTRLEEEFGGIGAVWITSLFFVLGHDQYHHLSILSIGSIVGLIPCTLGLGYVYLRTRSLIPGILLPCRTKRSHQRHLRFRGAGPYDHRVDFVLYEMAGPRAGLLGTNCFIGMGTRSVGRDIDIGCDQLLS